MALTIAAARFGIIHPAQAQQPGLGQAGDAFGPLEGVKAGLHNVGYAETAIAGPDVHSRVDLTTALAVADYRNGQQSVVAVDLVNLTDALRREGDDRRFRLECADRPYRRGAVAAAWQRLPFGPGSKTD